MNKTNKLRDKKTKKQNQAHASHTSHATMHPCNCLNGPNVFKWAKCA